MNNAIVESAAAIKKSFSETKAGLVKSADIVVVRGSFDHAEKCLEAFGGSVNFSVHGTIPNLSKHQLLIINCSNRQTYDLDRIKKFVGAGGWLITTDWGLANVIEKAFPNTIQRNTSSFVPDDVVTIAPVSDNHPLTQGVIPSSEFWLERGSYIIGSMSERVVNPLIVSNELKQKYGSDIILCGFGYGKGKVFHMVSHIELQRSKSGNTRVQDQYSSLMVLTNIIAHREAANRKEN